MIIHFLPLALAAAEPAEIVVTGQRLDHRRSDDLAGAVRIDRERLQEGASGRIEDSLALVPGLQSFRRSDSRSSNPSAQGLTLRGLGGNASSRTLVLLDGIPIADPFFGFVPLSSLDRDRIGSVTVVKGAGGGRFGSAVAGFISIDSLTPDQRADQRASGAISSTRALELGGGLTQRFGGSTATLDARWDKGRGFWTTPRYQRVSTSTRAAFDAASVDGRLLTPLAGGELQFRGAAYRDHRTLRFENADSRSEGLDASVRFVSARRDLTLAAYGQRRNFASKVVSATRFVVVLDQYRTPTTGAGAMAEWKPADWLAVGADVRWTSGTAYERALSAATGQVTATRANGGDILDLGAFADAVGRVGGLDVGASMRLSRWSITDGRSIERNGGGTLLRDERFSNRKGTTVSGRLTVGQQGGTFGWRAAVNSGIRVPTLNELYRGFTVFPVTTLANPDLKPERVIGAEAGLDWRPSAKVKAGVTLFANRLSNAISNVSLSPTLRRRENVDSLISRGIEADLSANFGQWGFDTSLSWLCARVDGRRPAQVPPLTGNATLRWADARRTVAVTLRHQAAAYEDDLNLDSLPATTTVDAVASQRIGVATLSLRLENALDERVVTRNQAGSIDLGAPRTVWLGLKLAN